MADTSGRLGSSDRLLLADLQSVLTQAINMILRVGDNLSIYHEVADIWHSARRMIEDAYHQSQTHHHNSDDRSYSSAELASLRTELWYACVYGERGLRDIYDYQTIFIPKIQKKRAELIAAGYNTEQIDDEIESWTYTWINEIRLHKKPQHAHVVVGVFPELPFQDQSFDRLIAS